MKDHIYYDHCRVLVMIPYLAHGGHWWLHRSARQISVNGWPGKGNAVENGHLGNGHIARDSQDDGAMQLVTGGTELSQRELIARAFAGDNVQAEFAEEKVLSRARISKQ